MRTCPVCGARCFDDMEVCYGCMHRFDERDEAATAVLQPLVGDACAFREFADRFGLVFGGA